MSRRGVALASVLWVIAAAAAIGLSIQVAARDLSQAVENRSILIRLRWVAYGCSETAIAGISAALSGPTYDPAWRRTWLGLDRVVQELPGISFEECSLSAIPAGSQYSARILSEAGAERMVAALGASIDVVGLSEALLDWEDSDEVARPDGGERAWYVRTRRVPPRNSVIQSLEELKLVRGFDAWPAAEAPLTLDRTPIAVNVASRAVLSALPGFDWNTAGEVMSLRSRGVLPASLQELLNHLSPKASEALIENFATLAERSVLDPWEWEVLVEARDGRTGLVARERIVLLPSDLGVSVREYRRW